MMVTLTCMMNFWNTQHIFLCKMQLFIYLFILIYMCNLIQSVSYFLQVTNYVVTRPAREILFTVTTREEKYKAKVFRNKKILLSLCLLREEWPSEECAFWEYTGVLLWHRFKVICVVILEAYWTGLSSISDFISISIKIPAVKLNSRFVWMFVRWQLIPLFKG